MELISLTKGKFAQVDDEDYDYLVQWKWQASSPSHTFYAVHNFWNGIKPDSVLMHREILKLTNSKILVDHIDHNGLNNQKYNLRECTFHQNLLNRKVKSGTSKYKGVSLKVDRRSKIFKFYWTSRITMNNKTIELGSFNNEIDAALAYNEAAKRIHGDFANLNKI